MKLRLLFFFSFLFINVFTFGAVRNSSSVINYQLNNNWEFKQTDSTNWFKATVPGCVHTDLLNNNLIPDPFYGTNEKKLQWIGKTDWDYQTTFDVPQDIFNKKNIDLVFEGLDTYADVYLNGSLILSANNMFREWILPVKPLLRETNNKIVIHFKNVFEVDIPKLETAPFQLLDQPNNDQSDTMLAMYSRKAQYEFGWDWGPRFITCGIWRNVFLRGWDEFKIENVQVIQKNVSVKKADLNCFINVSSDGNKNVSFNVEVDGKKYAEGNFLLKKGANKIPINFEILKPNLWWTNGLGSHYLYNLHFVVKSEDGQFDSNSQRIGIRSLEVVRQNDQYGESFFVKLNGVPVFMKGANYIPQDNFLNRVSPDRYRHIIKSAVVAHMNILRVWGGGIYENNNFYDLCDSNGILVWQEFMFACAMYPSDPAFLNNVKEEAIQNVIRLRNHPCIALFCGNNEDVVGWYQWGQKEKYPKNIQDEFEGDMHELYQVLLPSVVEQYDAGTYYHYTSPSAGFNNFPPSVGDIHYWGVWHGKEPFDTFNSNIARFVSEYGFQSYPEINTIKKFASPQDMEIHSDVMLSHQKCLADNRKDKEYGNRLIQWYMERQFKQPLNFSMYVYVSQVLQAEGDKIAIEAHRRNMPFCMGSMYWQIDDCWPVASWSSIDYYGNWKALHYYVKRAYKTFLISTEMKNDSLNFYVISDSLSDIKAQLEIKLLNLGGDILFRKSFPIDVKANTSFNYIQLGKNEFENLDPSKMFLKIELTSNLKTLAKNSFFFSQPKNLDLEKPDIKVTAVKNSEGYELKLSTNTLAKDVFLSFDKYDGFFTDNYFDLIPGETKTIEFHTGKNIDDVVNKLKVISLVDSYWLNKY